MANEYFTEAEKLGLVDGDEQIAGAMLLAAMQVGSELDKLAVALQTPAQELLRFHTRFREQDVFTECGRLNIDWVDDEDDDSRFVGFLCDVACGTGMLVRQQR
jgi:hypothetical protein